MKPVLLVPDTVAFDNTSEFLQELALGTGMMVVCGPEEELNKIRVVGDCEKCDGTLVKRYDPEDFKK